VHKNFAVYLDQPAVALDTILVSAGKRGVNLELSTKDLISITGATVIEATANGEN
jgi:Cys-tRNA(Pro)/Cys-tRNA(Cys) deacylase